MMLRVAIGHINHRQPLEQMPELVLVGHGDAAVQLRRLLADEFEDAMRKFFPQVFSRQAFSGTKEAV